MDNEKIEIKTTKHGCIVKITLQREVFTEMEFPLTYNAMEILRDKLEGEFAKR